MNKTALATLLSTALLGVAPSALAQSCPPGSWLCADLQINTGVPVVVQPPPPPVVVVQPPPPPPPPPLIVVQPVPRVVVQQPSVVVTSTPSYAVTTQTTYTVLGFGRNRALGLGGHLGGALLPNHGEGTETRGLGNIGMALRFRSNPWTATELAVDYFAGRDYNADVRAEVPISISQLFYVNPMNRFQVYFLAGLGGSIAQVRYERPADHHGRDSADYGYLGGQLGLGFEWQINPHLALFSDVRGFLRTRVDHLSDVEPEFRRTVAGREETTNTSVGTTFRLGGFIYF